MEDVFSEKKGGEGLSSILKSGQNIKLDSSSPKQKKIDVYPYVIYKAVDHPYPPPQPPRMGKIATVAPKSKGYFG